MKNLLWISLLLSPLVRAATLECGTYAVTGKLRWNPHGHYMIVVRERSTAKEELFVLGGEQEAKRKFQHRRVHAVVYVPKPIDGAQFPYTFLQDIAIAPIKEKDGTVLVEREACNLDHKFANR